MAYAPRLDMAAAAPWDIDPRRTAGIRAGMPLAEAAALGAHAEQSNSRRAAPRKTGARRSTSSPTPPEGAVGRLAWELHDPLADRVALEELAQWCARFSPIVGIEEAEPAESLLLDASGLGALAGGEAELVRQIVSAFRQRHLTVRVAMADTPGAAWAVAHFADLQVTGEPHALAAIHAAVQIPLVVPPGESWTALAPLCVEALRLEEATCALLAELGLRRIEQVAALPRSTLLARFGPSVLARLDQALGHSAEAIVARAAAEEWEYQWPFEHPTARCEMIEFVIERLVGRMCQDLARQRQGVLSLQCRFECEQGPPAAFIVGLYRPTAAEKHLNDLVRLKLEGLRFREPISAIRLTALSIDRLEFQQQEMFSAPPPSPLAGEGRGEGESYLQSDNFSLRLYQPASSPPHPACRSTLRVDAPSHPLPAGERDSLCATGSASALNALQETALAKLAHEGCLPEMRREHASELAVLVDRLSNRLGANAVVRPWLLAGAQPEFACHYRPLASLAARRAGKTKRGRRPSLVDSPKIPGDRPLLLEPRPLRLSAVSVAPEGPPAQFRAAGRTEQVVRAWGPERIETSWWRTRCVRRDYYQVETAGGARFWLFRELNTGSWYLHGSFA